jgi:hypothetical protein
VRVDRAALDRGEVGGESQEAMRAVLREVALDQELGGQRSVGAVDADGLEQ